MSELKIKKVVGREIIDSRGNPTVEAEVELECGVIGIQSGCKRKYRYQRSA